MLPSGSAEATIAAPFLLSSPVSHCPMTLTPSTPPVYKFPSQSLLTKVLDLRHSLITDGENTDQRGEMTRLRPHLDLQILFIVCHHSASALQLPVFTSLPEVGGNSCNAGKAIPLAHDWRPWANHFPSLGRLNVLPECSCSLKSACV